MSYQVLARKWRPQTFQEMVGQEHVLKALGNALDQDRLHHAYLFTGTRGVGKTTVARIFAKSLNCETGVGSQPCGQCAVCTEIAEGRFVDLIEIDAASRTKVEDMRELLDNVQYAPSRGRFKIYLIDEVHMLSNSSFNALLKTLEEPPPHIKFLLATTDPQKLPVTILSRCLQFSLKNLSPERIVKHLDKVLAAEGVTYEEAALWELAKAADGSMRDALSLTDQAIAYGNGSLRTAEVIEMLGTIEKHVVLDLLRLLVASDTAGALAKVGQLADFSPDYAYILQALAELLHRVAIEQAVPGSIDNSFGDQEEVVGLARQMSAEDNQLFYQIAITSRKDLPLAPDPRIGFEMALLRMISFRPNATSNAQLSQASESRPRSAGDSGADKEGDRQRPGAAGLGNQNEASPRTLTQGESGNEPEKIPEKQAVPDSGDRTSSTQATQNHPVAAEDKSSVETSAVASEEARTTAQREPAVSETATPASNEKTVSATDRASAASDNSPAAVKTAAEPAPPAAASTRSALGNERKEQSGRVADHPPAQPVTSPPPAPEQDYPDYDDYEASGDDLIPVREDYDAPARPAGSRQSSDAPGEAGTASVETTIPASGSSSANLSAQPAGGAAAEAPVTVKEVPATENDADQDEDQEEELAAYEQSAMDVDRSFEVARVGGNPDEEPVVQGLVWPELLKQIAVSGMTRSLAQRCSLNEALGQRLEFVIDEDHFDFFNDVHRNRLKTALSEFLGEPVTIEVTAGQSRFLSPLQRLERRRAELQAEAETEIRLDSNVNAMISRLGAELLDQTIEPVVTDL